MSTSSAGSLQKATTTSKDDDDGADMEQLLSDKSGEESRTKYSLEDIDAELTRYLRKPAIPTFYLHESLQTCNPLEWWKHHETKFPHLAKLACHYLSIISL